MKVRRPTRPSPNQQIILQVLRRVAGRCWVMPPAPLAYTMPERMRSRGWFDAWDLRQELVRCGVVFNDGKAWSESTIRLQLNRLADRGHVLRAEVGSYGKHYWRPRGM